MNDADCFALSEATDGAAAGADIVFGVILGTGVGGGIVVQGRALQGPNLITGEWGHNPLPWPTTEEVDGPSCYCGKRGCIETLLAGPFIEAAYAKRTGTAKKLVDIPKSDPLMMERIELFGRALSIIVNVVDPDVIVLGGGVSNLDALYTEGVAAVARWTFNDSLETKIVKHALGDSAGVLGAALLPPT